MILNCGLQPKWRSRNTTGKGQTHVYTLNGQAILFDMDGTLVDSSARIQRLWQKWSQRHDLDLDAILKVMSGRRAAETIRLVAPHLVVEEEVSALEADEIADMDGVLVYPGVATLLGRLPRDRWAIVTSGAWHVAEARLRHVGLPVPAVLVTAEDVRVGKPDPEGYRRAAERLGIAPGACIVIEDAPAGVCAGKAAGMQVVAVTTTHARAALADADVVISALAALDVRISSRGLELCPQR